MDQDGLKLYQWAEETRSQLSKNSIFQDPKIFKTHHKVLVTYKTLLTRHLDYSVGKRVENDLWNFGFKDWISRLQSESKPRVLEWFLDYASGYYNNLLSEVPSDSRYMGQHILVHLGDLARYKNQRGQALTFYHRAISDFPEFGQSYNQLGLLSSEDDLKAVFYYVMAVSVKNRFPSANTNLSKMLGKVSEKSNTFLRCHGLIHYGNLKRAARLLKEYEVEIGPNHDLIQMAIVTMFQLERYKEDAGRQRILTLEVFSLLLEASLSDPVMMIPGIKLMLDYIIKNPAIIGESGFNRRCLIWPRLCELLNDISSELRDIDDSTFLPEDTETSEFLPLKDDTKKSDSSVRQDDSSRHHELIAGLSPLSRRSYSKCDNVDDIRQSRVLKCGHLLVTHHVLKFSEEFTPSKDEKVQETDLLDQLIEEMSDDEDPELKEITNNTKPPPRKNRNAALSAILRMKRDKPKVSFKIEDKEDTGRFLGLNGPPQLQQHMKLASEILLSQDFTVPPPNMASSSGLGRIGPTSSPSQTELTALPRLRPPPPQPSPGRDGGYSLFSGQGMWPSGGPPLPTRPPDNNHMLFQPGPSPLELLLQENNVKQPQN